MSKPIYVKQIPEDLREDFDIARLINSIGLTECIIELVQGYVKLNRKSIDAIKKERAKRAGKK